MCQIFSGLFAIETLASESEPVEQPARSPEEVGAMLSKLDNLQPPAIPLDYVDWTILCTGSDRLLTWMNANDIPEAARWLFNIICFFGLYRLEAAKNGGMVSEEMNDSAREYLIKALNCMQELGEDW